MITLLVGLVLTASPITADSPYCDPDAGIVTDCIAVQLPDEHEGAELDCPDGQIGTVMGGEVVCPATPTDLAPVTEEPAQVASTPPAMSPAATSEAKPSAPAPVTATPSRTPAPSPHRHAPTASTPSVAAQAEATVTPPVVTPAVTPAAPADDMAALRAFIPQYFRDINAR